jgi:glucose/arabinose dehydrogenase
MRKAIPLAMLTAILLAGCATPAPTAPQGNSAKPNPAPAAKPDPASLKVPPGFTVKIFATGMQGARHMAQGPDGAIYVAERDANRVSRLPDTNGDGVADSVEPYASGVEKVHGVEWHDGALYAGATDGIYRFDGKGKPGTKLVTLPSGGRHFTRTAHFGPDGKLYVAIGSSCNVCVETEPHRASIWVYNADGSGGRLFAKGLRNTVDFAFEPKTGAIFGGDNGRDDLGENVPPEELNLIKDGGDYGWPVCHGGDIVDPDFGKQGACEGKTAPALKMQAHSAPLGAQFYTGTQFPETYQGRLFLTFHGSWNRSEKTGYKVVSIPFKDGKPSGPPEDFITGWLNGANASGRPVGVLQTKDGALLVSDDTFGAIYRITYTGTGR